MRRHAQLFLILNLYSLRLPTQLCFVNNISFCLLWHLPDQKSQKMIPYLAFSFSSSWFLGAVSIHYLRRIPSFKLINTHIHTLQLVTQTRSFTMIYIYYPYFNPFSPSIFHFCFHMTYVPHSSHSLRGLSGLLATTDTPN